MPTREEKIKEIERLTKIKEIETLRAQQSPEPSAQSPKLSSEQSALYGAAQGATFGFADEGIAAFKALKDKVTDGGDYRDLYKTRVAAERQTLDEARRENPKSYIAGELAGAIPTMAIPGLGIARGAKLGTSLAKASAQGALVAAGESQVDPTDSPDAAAQLGKDIFKGATIGGATQFAFSGAGGLLEKLKPSALKQFASERAVKATTGQNISALRKMTGTTFNSPGDVERAQAALDKTGRHILDEGALNPLDTIEDLAPKISEARKKYGSLIGEIGDKIDETAPNAVDAKKIANDLMAYAETIPATEAGKRLQDKIFAEAANFEKLGRMSFSDAQKFKNQFRYKPVDADALISNQDATNKIRSIISKQMDDTADVLAKNGPEETRALLGQYKDAKSKYGSFKGASDAATDRVQKNLSNRFPSPSDYGVGASAGLLGALTAPPGGSEDSTAKYFVYGALAAMGNKFARTRGSSLAAVASDSIANALDKSPDLAKKFGKQIIEAANRGPAALVTTHQMLMKSPEYRKNFEKEDIERQKQALKRRLGE